MSFPNNRHGNTPPYLLSAYGIAVKHGYTGTEEEWLASLKGDEGEYPRMQFDSETGYLQIRYDDSGEWTDIASLADLMTESEEAVVASAKEYADTAEAYAKGTVDGEAVEEDDPGYEDNAKYYAGQASTYASAAGGFATGASNYAQAASGYATTASGHADNAAASATAAAGSATSAAGSAASASNSAGSASTSASAAEAQATQAGTYAYNADQSAQQAASYAAAANTAYSAVVDVANGVDVKVEDIETQVSIAAGYATNAGTSATNAATSATAASGSATAAAGSATAAAGSASDAADSATAAAGSATAAAGSASSVSASAAQITTNKNDIADLKSATELAEPVSFADNKYVNNTGYIGDNNDYALSYFYECALIEKVYTAYSNGYSIAYYNESKTFLSMQNVSNNSKIVGWLKLDPPVNAVYFRFDIYKPSINTSDAKIEYKYRLKLLDDEVKTIERSIALEKAIAYTDGKYVNNTGYEGTNSSYAISDYYECEKYSKVYTAYGQDYTIAYYDDEKTFLSMKAVNNTGAIVGWIDVDIPTNAVYFRFNIYKPNLDPDYAKMQYRYIGKHLDYKIDSLPFVTPQMFGAIADGTHDDADAIQAAIDSNKRVILPKGTYAISKPLQITAQGTYIEGEENVSWNNGIKAVISVKSGSALTAFINLDVGASNFQLKNVWLLGNSSYVPNNGIVFNPNSSDWISDVRLENVFIEKCGTALYLNKVYKSVFVNVRTGDCSDYGFRLTGKTPSPAVAGTSITMINCYANKSNRSYTLERISYSSLINCASDASTNYDYCATLCSNISYISCGCERSKGNPFYFTGTNIGIQITGFDCVELGTLTSGLDDAFISCHGMINCNFSGINLNSSILRAYDIYNKATVAHDSITVLDDSLSPTKCRNVSDRRIVFSRRTVMYDTTNPPEFVGQFAVDGGLYISLDGENWTALT